MPAYIVTFTVTVSSHSEAGAIHSAWNWVEEQAWEWDSPDGKVSVELIDAKP